MHIIFKFYKNPLFLYCFCPIWILTLIQCLKYYIIIFDFEILQFKCNILIFNNNRKNTWGYPSLNGHIFLRGSNSVIWRQFLFYLYPNAIEKSYFKEIYLLKPRVGTHLKYCHWIYTCTSDILFLNYIGANLNETLF